VCGLPNDNLSVENGIIIATARRDETVGIIHGGAWSTAAPRRWPLMIDPQRQAAMAAMGCGWSVFT